MYIYLRTQRVGIELLGQLTNKQMNKQADKQTNKAIKDGGSTAGLPPNNKKKTTNKIN